MTQPLHAVWIGLALALLLLGLLLGNVLLLTGAVFVLVTIFAATALPPPSSVALERGMSKLACWVGETLEVRREISVSNGIGPVFVHDKLPPEAEVVNGSNLRVVWKWPGILSADVSYQLQFPKRGLYPLPAPGWESQAPLGANRGMSGSSGEAFEVSVVPRIRNVTRLNEVRAVRRFGRYQDDLAKTGATTDEFKEIRPYQPGDPFKRINWKASARSSGVNNVPLVNEWEPETKRAVWIFLDTANYMDVGVPLSNPLESTVEASGTLAQYYLSRGSTLGAYAYNGASGVGELLAPEGGMRQFNQLMGMLAGLKSGPADQDLLQAIERCKGFLYRIRPDFFVITRLDVYYPRPGEEAASFERFMNGISRLISLKSRSTRTSRVRVVHVEPEEAREQSSGLGLAQWEARHVGREVRQRGASVIEWQPAREEFTSLLVRHIDAYE